MPCGLMVQQPRQVPHTMGSPLWLMQAAGFECHCPAPAALCPRPHRPAPVSQPPNVLVNEVSYKTLGFLPGSVRQEGEITPISSDTFEVRGRAGAGRGQRPGQVGEAPRFGNGMAGEEGPMCTCVWLKQCPPVHCPQRPTMALAGMP